MSIGAFSEKSPEKTIFEIEGTTAQRGTSRPDILADILPDAQAMFVRQQMLPPVLQDMANLHSL